MKNISLTVTAIACILLSGCSRHMVSQDELANVESVAVVMYSVPGSIVADDRDATEITGTKEQGLTIDPISMAGDLLGGTTKKIVNFFDDMSGIQQTIDGNEAADLAVTSMLAELHQKNGWRLLTPQEVAENKQYQALTAGLLQSQSMQLEQKVRRKAGVPDGYINIGLPHSHAEMVNYYDYPEFRQWTAKTAQALNVDAVIVVSDTGFATDQRSLLRGGGCYTKSAFHYAMFNTNGELIVDTRGSFDEAPKIPQKGCVKGMFHKVDYKAALIEHGKEQARVITERLKEA